MKTVTFTRLLAAAVLAAILLPTTVIKAQESSHKIGSLFTVDDKKFHGGFSVGWVAKDWTTSIGGETLREDLWGNPNKMLNGVQFGLYFHQCIRYGVGWRTGFYYEWYINHDQFLRDNGWDRFNEHCLYIPLHAQFRLPLARRNKKISITPYAGIGFNIAMKGRFKNGPMTGPSGREVISGGDNYFDTDNFLVGVIASAIDYAVSRKEYIQHEVQNYEYGNHTPNKFNLQAELGVALRIYAAELAFTYSWGLTGHRLYDGLQSRQNKLNLKLGVIF